MQVPFSDMKKSLLALTLMLFLSLGCERENPVRIIDARYEQARKYREPDRKSRRNVTYIDDEDFIVRYEFSDKDGNLKTRTIWVTNKHDFNIARKNMGCPINLSDISYETDDRDIALR